MLPYKLNLANNKVAIVANFTDNGYKTIFGYTYDELLEMYDEETIYRNEYEYNNGKGICPNGIYGNCYYRHYNPLNCFTAFGVKVLHVNIRTKKSLKVTA